MTPGDVEMRTWPLTVEQQDANYLMFRRHPAHEDEWYFAVVRYRRTFRPAPASVTAPPPGLNWTGPFRSIQDARAAAQHAIADGCVTPSFEG